MMERFRLETGRDRGEKKRGGYSESGQREGQ